MLTKAESMMYNTVKPQLVELIKDPIELELEDIIRLAKQLPEGEEKAILHSVKRIQHIIGRIDQRKI